jgi:hypothetical protein
MDGEEIPGHGSVSPFAGASRSSSMVTVELDDDEEIYSPANYQCTLVPTMGQNT